MTDILAKLENAKAQAKKTGTRFLNCCAKILFMVLTETIITTKKIY